MIRSFGQTVVGEIQSYEPVTDAMLTNPPEGDWLVGRGNYANWSYSTLKQIDTANIHDLQLQWVWAMNEGSANVSRPQIPPTGWVPGQYLQHRPGLGCQDGRAALLGEQGWARSQ